MLINKNLQIILSLVHLKSYNIIYLYTYVMELINSVKIITLFFIDVAIS